MVRWFHNENLAVIWAWLVEIVVHGLMAAGAFALGAFLGDIALSAILPVPLATQVGAWLLAIVIFCSAFQAFVLGEYLRDHVRSYESTTKGDGSYMRSWTWIRWIVGGLEFSCLAFRCYIAWAVDGKQAQAVILGVLGLLALVYAFAQAKVIHASVNRPPSYDVLRSKEEVERSLTRDVLKFKDLMTPAEKSQFVYRDNPEGLDAAQHRYQPGLIEQWHERRRNRKQVKDEYERRISDEYQRAADTQRKMTDRPFDQAQTKQADRLSQNGRQ